MYWRFLHPWLLLLLIIPVVWLIIDIIRKKKTAKIVFSDLSIFGDAPKSWRIRIMPFLSVFRFLSICFIILALARPQYGRTESVQSARGIDISMVLDISSTMDAADYKPTRLQVAKNVMGQFIEERINDRVGVIIFGTSPYVLVPPSFDQSSTINSIEAIDGFLSEIRLNRLDQQLRMTAIGSGLALAVDQLKDSDAESKVVILLTDGENNAGEIKPITAAEIAETFGVRVYTIGLIAKSSRSVLNSESNIDREELQKIAQITGGKFFSASNEEALSSIYQEIDELEKSEMETAVYDNFAERFLIFLGPGIGLLAIEMLLRLLIFRRLP